MKRFYFVLSCVAAWLYTLAQKGHIRPEDYEDLEDLQRHSSSSSGDYSVLLTVIIILFIVVIVLFNIAIKSSNQKEINQRVTLQNDDDLTCYTTADGAIRNGNIYKRCKSYFEEENGAVTIPAKSKCIILEYVKGNSSIVKIKFDNYSRPLYVQRWRIKSDKDRSVHDRNK